MAVPTTAGTGSETTGVAIFDLTRMRAKTGIANRRLKPTLGYLDPENTRTLPPEVAAASGLDVLSHALESYTAIPYTARPRPERPALRPAYQGSNPISDVWALQALDIVSRYLIRAVEDPSDDEARSQMLLAASYAGVGFGNAGVLVPHGMSVILNAPAVFQFTASADPQRHLRAAAALGCDVTGARAEDAGRILSDRIVWFMHRLKMPNGLSGIGYSTRDIPVLVEGTLPQHRVTKLAPRPAGADDLAMLFERAMTCW
jgi:hydroxyacid-oxoacid transhydrogenase